MQAPSETSNPDPQPAFGRFLNLFRPSHEHTARSATALLATTILLSRLIGFLREMYIAWAFGATSVTDAYNAGFTIPDWVNYLAAGGTASITFISIYTRFMAEGREEEAQKTFSVVVTVMSVVLGAGILMAGIFAPELNHLMFGRKMNPAEFALCVHISRILLPAQFFFYVGGIASAVLQTRRMFLIPAIGPLFYSGGIIFGGVLFSGRLGISSLAWGGIVGSFLGIFLLNVIWAARAGVRYRVSFAVGNPAFREWIRLSIPLMLGVSLVTADEWIQRYFAAGSTGDITRLTYARRLFQVPLAILGQAVSQASLPFFARLFGEKRMEEFSQTVTGSVYRVFSIALLLSSFMSAAALPLVDLVYRRGRLDFSDSERMAVYFSWFALSLAFWAAQALYARAFYAAGNTLTPMIASTIVTAASLPLYWALFRSFSTTGLVMASDLGIAANCLTMAFLLDRRRLVSARRLDWGEMAKALVVALAAGALSARIAWMVPFGASRVRDLKALLMIGGVWIALVIAGLWLTKSKLFEDLGRRPPGALSPE
ncbi:MAG: murein biosynthesis integral membrane protein MurJ [Acidobacteria bacterium]|nr:murein biosynthesis integral membrane protein MurJ [Acidobacteriota bacterium]